MLKKISVVDIINKDDLTAKTDLIYATKSNQLLIYYMQSKPLSIGIFEWCLPN